ncbi:MAG: hypothetical protein Kow00107_01500 [Planctomycetota bacterium]
MRDIRETALPASSYEYKPDRMQGLKLSQIVRNLIPTIDIRQPGYKRAEDQSGTILKLRVFKLPNGS